MPKINRKTTLIASAVLVVLAVGFIVFRATQNKQTVSEKFQQNLNVPNYFQPGALPIESSINALSFKFPATLPYLQTTPTSTLDRGTASNIATNIGFTPSPQTYNDIQNGTVSLWSNDNYSLLVTFKTGSVQLSSNKMARVLIQNAKDNNITDDEFKSTAQDFLINKIGISQNELKFLGFTYLKTQNGVENFVKTDKNGAELVQLNYSESTSNYPIITANPDQAQITIQYLKDGTLYALNANMGFKFQESANQYPLKNFDQFNGDIKNSILVSLNDNNVNLPDVKTSSIQSIKISSVSLAYLLDFSNQGVVQPVFLLEGEAVIKGFSGPVSASLYLPAFEGFGQP